MGKRLGRKGGLSPCKSPGKDRRCRMHVRQGTEAIQSLLVIPLEPSPDGRNTIENTCKAPSRRQHGAATARVPLLCRTPQESVSQDRPEQGAGGVECGRPGGPAVALAGRCMDGARLELLGARTNTPPRRRLPTRFRALAPRRGKPSLRALTAATLCYRDRCCIPPEGELDEMAASEVAGSPAGLSPP